MAMHTVLTPDAPSKAGSVMSEERIDLRKAFSMSFEFNVGADDAAAPMACIRAAQRPCRRRRSGSGGRRSRSTRHPSTVSASSSTSSTIPVAYLEPTADHTNIFDTDNLTSDPAVTAPTSLGNIEDGQWHQVQIVWNGADS